MEAKDTTLTPGEIKQGCSEYIDHGGIGSYCMFKPTLKRYGKIYCTRHDPVRLKARMDKRLAQDEEARKRAEQGKINNDGRLRQEGRREVVEWIKECSVYGIEDNKEFLAEFEIDLDEWQAKLKEWNLRDDD